MVEINNQRKAFLDMLAWSEGTDNGRRNQRGYDVIVGGELFTDYPDHPQTCHVQKLKSTGAGRYQLLSCWWDALPQAAWPERLLSEKSGRCGTSQQIKECGALPFFYD